MEELVEAHLQTLNQLNAELAERLNREQEGLARDEEELRALTETISDRQTKAQNEHGRVAGLLGSFLAALPGREGESVEGP